MKFSEQWLRSWVNPSLDSEQLAHLLTMSGLEVEENEPAAPAFSQVVVAEVLSVQKHENADRLNVCRVNIGEAEPLQIVCGAPNVAPGLKVPCARIGAVLPGDFKIKQAKVRSVESFGMLCSAKELGIAEDASGLMVLPADAPVGQALRDYLTLDDRLLTLKLTPNRADCLSIRGIAREVAALTGVSWQPITVSPAQPTLTDTCKVTLSAPEACPRYAGRIIRGVNQTAPTPLWMQQRLERAGVRSISAIVDVTNYVLLELGQPMHAFDLAKLQGGITVRFAQAGESITLLNDKELKLEPDMLVIADDKRPVALAGIMGGSETSVDGSTQDIFLESAFFAPIVIAGKSRRIGFGSDSSFRFERGVDFGATHEALERATQLILDICGGQVGPIVEQVATLPARPAVTLRISRVAKVVGMPLTASTIVTILENLGLHCQSAGDDTLTVTPPSYRFDIEIEEDLIEEIIRVHGYDKIPVHATACHLAMLPQPGAQRSRFNLRNLLAARDYQEAVTYAFVDAKWEADIAGNSAPVKLLNPIASQMSVMRSTLMGGLINALQYNINRKQDRVRLFELGRVFHGAQAGQQPEHLAALAWGLRYNEQWSNSKDLVDFFDLKGDIEALLLPRVAEFRPISHPALHPGRSAEVFVAGQSIGLIGELHPHWVSSYDLGSAPVVFELALDALLSIDKQQAKPVSRFQPVRRDLALLVDEHLSAATLLSAFAQTRNKLVAEIAVFDVYRGKGVPAGRKSLAFKVLMQDTQKTLTEGEVDAVVAQLVEIAQTHGATLRA